MDLHNRFTYEQLQTTAAFIKQQIPATPLLVGIICGSGLGQLADSLVDRIEIAYETIPYFPTSSVKGHGGMMVIGHLNGVPVICMKGRFHFYEGYPLWKVTMPVRVMRLLGVQYLIVTNAAGAINSDYKVGDVMLIKDHVNFVGMAGMSPLNGPNDDNFGPRFPPMNKAYDRELFAKAKEIAAAVGIADKLHQGVYACLGGPCYETIAELNMLKICGADAVGMSSAHEVIIAQHCGMRIFGFSLITNIGNLDYDSNDVPDHEEVLRAAKAMEEPLKIFVGKIVEYIGSHTATNPTGGSSTCPGTCKKG